MMDCLAKWEVFLQDRESFPELIQCALLHEQFEAIHPFLDGNGCIGRLLITLFLMERGRLSQPLLYLSAYIETHWQEYYDLLQRVRTHGDWHSWLHYFLHGIEEVSKQAVRQAGALMGLREQLHIEIRSKPKAAELIDPLFTNPLITTSRATDLLNVSQPNARQVVGILIESGVLQEVTGQDWGKIYVAARILNLIDDFTE